MFDEEICKNHFRSHRVKYTDYGNIKILDFLNPQKAQDRIRFLFEEDFYRLHISGDFGELVAESYCNMTFEKFSEFVNNINYFETKILCMSEKRYWYNEEKGQRDLLMLLDADDKLENVIEEIFEDFSPDSGLSPHGVHMLLEIDEDILEYVPEIGKERTGILELYMIAFKMAMDSLINQINQ